MVSYSLKAFILSLALSISYSATAFALPKLEQSQVVTSIPAEIKEAMYQLQTMAEVFASDSGGLYPSSLEELHQVAIDNGYDFRKPSPFGSEQFAPQNPLSSALLILDGREANFLLTQAPNPLLAQHYTIMAHPTRHQGSWKTDTDLAKLPTKGAVVYYPLSEVAGGPVSGYLLVWLTPEYRYAYQVSAKSTTPQLFNISNN